MSERDPFSQESQPSQPEPEIPAADEPVEPASADEPAAAQAPTPLAEQPTTSYPPYGGYEGYQAPGPTGQADQGQPYQGQAYQGQAYQGQAYQGQAYQGQGSPGQEYQTQPGYGAGPPPGAYATGYAAGGYGYPPAGPRTDDKAVWALVSSIAGYLLCPIVLHIVGWVLANQSIKAIRDSRGALTGDGIARTARVLSIVGVVLYGIGAAIAILFFALLIPLGVFAAGTATTSMDFESRTVTPGSIEAIDEASFSHDAGDITYDLTDLDFSEQDVTMSIDLGAGSLTIDVPDDVTVTVDARVGAGSVDLFGDSSDGIGVSRDRTFEGAGSGTLDLSAEVGVGELELNRG